MDEEIGLKCEEGGEVHEKRTETLLIFTVQFRVSIPRAVGSRLRHTLLLIEVCNGTIR